MELKEFVRLDPNQIRRNNELMQLFVNFYEAAFFIKPNCAGCVFKKGFKKLVKYANKGEKIIIFNKKINKMESKTFELKKQYKLKILTYKKDGITHRKYGHAITEDFAKELVLAGKEDYFSKLPNSEVKKIKEVASTVKDVKQIEVIVVKDYYSMDYRDEVLPLYAQLKEKTGNKAESNKKDDIIAFIQENEG